MYFSIVYGSPRITRLYRPLSVYYMWIIILIIPNACIGMQSTRSLALAPTATGAYRSRHAPWNSEASWAYSAMKLTKIQLLRMYSKYVPQYTYIYIQMHKFHCVSFVVATMSCIRLFLVWEYFFCTLCKRCHSFSLSIVCVCHLMIMWSWLSRACAFHGGSDVLRVKW